MIYFPGRLVLIVNGRYRGQKGTLITLDEKTFSVSVEIKEVILTIDCNIFLRCLKSYCHKIRTVYMISRSNTNLPL